MMTDGKVASKPVASSEKPPEMTKKQLPHTGESVQGVLWQVGLLTAVVGIFVSFGRQKQED